LTSDLIWRDKLTKKGKPIVVSMETTQLLVAITSLVMPIQFCQETQLQDQLGVLEY
jgi:hypothetical protein